MSTALVPATVSPELIDQINAEHAACQASYGTALEHAIACGNLLYEAHMQIAHGGWRPWVEGNFGGSLRTADAYIQLANAARQQPELVQEAGGSIQAAIAFIGRQASGANGLKLKDDDDDVVDAEVVPEPTFTLTISQLVSLAGKRWHRPPGEKEIRAWLKDAGIT